MSGIIEGIFIGGFGGAAAGIMVYVIQHHHAKKVEAEELNKVEKWMEENVDPSEGKKYRSTRAIASFNNITMDRARYICSISDKIHLSTGPKEDLWGLNKNSKSRSK